MLLPIWLAAALLPAQEVSAHCVGTGSEIASSQTERLRGPSGMAAVLRVSTADDHSKNSHECNAEYQLLISHPGAGTPVLVDLLTSDAEYDRILSLRLEGFSQDGKGVFGILSEAGKYPSTTLFEYDIAGGKVQLIDLRKPFANRVAPKCGTTFDVIGTTETGAIALELNSAEKCSPTSRWLLNPTSGKPQRLPQGQTIVSLYQFKGDAP
jgi:hypothetical protein